MPSLSSPCSGSRRNENAGGLFSVQYMLRFYSESSLSSIVDKLWLYIVILTTSSTPFLLHSAYPTRWMLQVVSVGTKKHMAAEPLQDSAQAQIRWRKADRGDRQAVSPSRPLSHSTVTRQGSGGDRQTGSHRLSLPHSLSLPVHAQAEGDSLSQAVTA
jgi:hypothetical protein